MDPGYKTHLYVRFITGLSVLRYEENRQAIAPCLGFELHHEDVRCYYSFEYKAKSWKYIDRG